VLISPSSHQDMRKSKFTSFDRSLYFSPEEALYVPCLSTRNQALASRQSATTPWRNWHAVASSYNTSRRILIARSNDYPILGLGKYVFMVKPTSSDARNAIGCVSPLPSYMGDVSQDWSITGSTWERQLRLRERDILRIGS
jgi:hypothetical protein